MSVCLLFVFEVPGKVKVGNGALVFFFFSRVRTRAGLLALLSGLSVRSLGNVEGGRDTREHYITLEYREAV